MSNKIDPNILLDHVTPEVIGIFWLTSKPLDRALLGFDQLNYLFDGLLSQFIYGENITDKRSNIFFTDNYSKTLFLAHIKTEGASPSELSGDIDEQIALVQSNIQGRFNILVVQDTTNDWLKELQKRYDQFTFIKINLE